MTHPKSRELLAYNYATGNGLTSFPDTREERAFSAGHESRDDELAARDVRIVELEAEVARLSKEIRIDHLMLTQAAEALESTQCDCSEEYDPSTGIFPGQCQRCEALTALQAAGFGKREGGG